jgi:histidine triad (HIT) family protein
VKCLGCRLATKKELVHVVLEDEYVCCILDNSPYNEGHVLILPKKHIRYFDELTYFHMHVVPRYEEQNFADFYTEDVKTYIEGKTKLEETKRKMIAAIEVLG